MRQRRFHGVAGACLPATGESGRICRTFACLLDVHRAGLAPNRYPRNLLSVWHDVWAVRIDDHALAGDCQNHRAQPYIIATEPKLAEQPPCHLLQSFLSLVPARPMKSARCPELDT
jgi:hypothetical protein